MPTEALKELEYEVLKPFPFKSVRPRKKGDIVKATEPEARFHVIAGRLKEKKPGAAAKKPSKNED